jgi:glycosyltransferase involved in cell wall biosynthesis
VGGQTNASYLRKLGMADDQIFLGYDVVDNDHFSSKSTIARATEPSVRKKLGLPRRYILACARFTLKKNLPFLVTAYSSFVRRFGSDAPSLVMLGDGPLRSELESLTLSLNLKHKVHFHGFQSYETIPSYYALAEAFVHPSTVEQWGLVVNEAMACGTPVLVSKPCGAAAELVKEGVTGYTFDPQNRDELAARIYDLTSDPERRAGLSRNCLDEIALWSPARFVSGLRQAMHRARGDYRGPSPLNRLLARGLSGLR